MSAAVWPVPHPAGASIVDGIVYCREEEEEPFTSDILTRHPDCLAEPMAEEYARLYAAHGEEKAETFLQAISHQLGSTVLSLSATNEDIAAFARKKADEFTRLQFLFKNPVIAAQVLSDLANRKYSVTFPWMKTAKIEPTSLSVRKQPTALPLPSVSVSVTVKEENSDKHIPVSVTDTGSKMTVPVTVTVTVTGNQTPVTVTGKTDTIDPVTVTAKSLPFPVRVTGKSQPSLPVSVTDTGREGCRNSGSSF